MKRLGAERFDVLIIGGGATGAGALLDASSRGLKAALVERADFGQGTSSRSTKLLHGGVRYLEQAVKRLDRGQFALVKAALRERAIVLRNAPHLAHPIALITPLYRIWELPYYATGLKLYDMLAGRENLRPSHSLGRGEALQRFPMLKPTQLRGAVEYYDGQFDDARLNIGLITTASRYGAVALNYAEVVELTKSRGTVTGAIVRLADTGETLEVSARTVINATGPFADDIRQLDEREAQPILKASSGSHIVLPARFSPPGTGLLIPKTEDGRVLFLLPWQGHTLVGTTDHPAPVTANPRASEEDIDYILRHVRAHFDIPVDRADVLAAWSGLRPLVQAGSHDGTTAGLSRDHLIKVSESNLVTITGGKWTTYRKMAADAVDAAVRIGSFDQAGPSCTVHLKLDGAEGYKPGGEVDLIREFGLEPDIARHLYSAYGSLASNVGRLALEGLSGRLAPGHPHIEAEVVYARDNEYGMNSDDVLHRRIRLAFLDTAAAEAARPRVEELLKA